MVAGVGLSSVAVLTNARSTASWVFCAGSTSQAWSTIKDDTSWPGHGTTTSPPTTISWIGAAEPLRTRRSG